jgi:hypothetical protein
LCVGIAGVGGGAQQLGRALEISRQRLSVEIEQRQIVVGLGLVILADEASSLTPASRSGAPARPSMRSMASANIASRSPRSDAFLYHSIALA